jgi:hypothetical protein
MSNTGTIVAEQINHLARGRKLNVGLLYRSGLDVAKEVIGLGHRTVVFGDGFRRLYLLWRLVVSRGYQNSSLIEMNLGALALSERSLDVVVITYGMPAIGAPLATLTNLRKILKPDGLLIWIHPARDGFFGAVSRKMSFLRFGMVGTLYREKMTRLMMEAGFGAVSQVRVNGGSFPWIVTTGKTGRRPWEMAV